MTNLGRERVTERCLDHFAILTGFDTTEEAVADLINESTSHALHHLPSL